MFFVQNKFKKIKTTKFKENHKCKRNSSDDIGSVCTRKINIKYEIPKVTPENGADIITINMNT